LIRRKMINHIKKYLAAGYSVFPVKHDKRPYFSWEEYQHRKPTKDELNAWWGSKGKYVGSNIAIVTGETSNLTVIDIDSKEGEKAIQEFIPPKIDTPIVKTPSGGYHLYFQHERGIGNRTRFLTDCDIRSEGGYVVAPPSTNGGAGAYVFVKENALVTARLPDTMRSCILNTPNYIISTITANPVPNSVDTCGHRDLSFDKGSRDDTLFHVANCLVKGGMPVPEIEQILSLISSKVCNPPFPEKEIQIKVKSAVQRSNRKERNLMDEVREFVLSTSGHFLSTEVHKWTQVSTRREKKTISECLRRLTDEGLIERTGDRNGQFRLIDKDAKLINYKKNFTDHDLDLILPLGIHRWIYTFPKSLFVFAGAPDSGKTALMLNVARLNQKEIPTYYFSSEMGDQELNSRLSKFDDITIDHWNFTAKERASNFADVIEPNALNIIDFLEITDSFYRISGDLTAIYNRLNKGVAIVCIQKAPKARLGRGASFSLEKPRLYCTVDRGKLSIIKAKNWRDSEKNPNNQAINFKIVRGCEIIPDSGWYYDEPIDL